MFKNVRKVTKLGKMIIISRCKELKAHSKNPMNERRKNSKNKDNFTRRCKKSVTSSITEPNPHWALSKDLLN